MIGWYIRKVIASEIAAAKKQGMKEGLSKTAEKVIKKYLDKNLESAVIEHATKPKVCAAFDELTKAIMEKDMHSGYMHHFMDRPFRFMERYFNKLRNTLKEEGSKEANNILNQFIAERATSELKKYISDPEQLKFIISKINEFQVSSTGKV